MSGERGREMKLALTWDEFEKRPWSGQQAREDIEKDKMNGYVPHVTRTS